MTSRELIRVADGVVDPTEKQVLWFRGFYEERFGTLLSDEEICDRLRHIASLYALLRGHERPRPK